MPPRTNSQTSSIAKAWFERLANAVWFSPDVGQGLRWTELRLQQGHTMCRPLSKEEMRDIRDIVRTHGLTCQMQKGDMNYHFCVTVYDRPKQKGDVPEPVFAFSDRHLPSSGGKWLDPSYAWSALSLNFTHTPDNLEQLVQHGLPKPEGRDAYET